MAVLSPTYEPEVTYDSGNAAYWDTVTFDSGTTKHSADPGVIGGSLVQVAFTRSEAAGVREDIALFGLHLAVSPGVAGEWSELTDGTKASVETALDAWWTTCKTLYSDHIKLSEYIWRDYGADYPLGATGLSKPSPVNRRTSRTVAGTGVGTTLPDQTAMSVTFKTASRRHWGRVYLPPPQTAGLTQYSRFTSGYCDTVAGAFNTMFDTLTNLGTAVHPRVWSPKYRGMFSVAELHVDDVPDVIRSRRPKTRTYRKDYGA